MRISKVIKAVLVLAAVILVNLGLDYALEPNFGSANLMWEDLVKEEQLDMVYVGSSLCQRNIDPLAVDEVTGKTSYNMGTSAQTLLASEDAVRTAHERFGIKTAVLVIGYSTFDADQGANSDIAWLRAKERFGVREGMNRLDFVLSDSHIGRETSLNFLVPWVNNHVNFIPSVILNNIAEKRNGVDAVTSELKHNYGMEYPGRGFECYMGSYDPDEAGKDTSLRAYANEYEESELQRLQKICAYCRENGIQLYVINAPKPAYDILAYGEAYGREGRMLEEQISAWGAQYYDFGLLRPEHYVIEESSFIDKEHMNRTGAELFSPVLGKYLVRLENGEDISADFRSYEELKEDTAEVKAAWFACEAEEDDLKLHGEAYGGSEPEYRYMIADGDTYNVLREYSTDPDLVYVPAGHGTLRIRLEVRTGDTVRSCEQELIY